jgi:uncharacterized SAM-binding protein YcdF (DUF218 family)
VRSTRRRVAWVLLLIAAGLTFTLPFWLPLPGHALISASAPIRADAILVLAGDRFGSRLIKGAELARQSWAPVVYMSSPRLRYEWYEDELALPFLERRGYPRTMFHPLRNESRSTSDEARLLLPELRKRKVRDLLLVTSDYHTRRSGRLFRRMAERFGMHVTVIAAPDREFHAAGWWRSRESRKLVFYEWIKLFAEEAGGL